MVGSTPESGKPQLANYCPDCGSPIRVGRKAVKDHGKVEELKTIRRPSCKCPRAAMHPKHWTRMPERTEDGSAGE